MASRKKSEEEEAAEEQLEETVEQYFDEIVAVSVMVPLGNINDPNCRMGLPAIFWGKSGIGKSGRIEAVTTSLALPYAAVYPGTKQPEDFSGTPVFTPQGGLRLECILGPVRDLMQYGYGLLFIDEASCAVPAVQGAMLSLVYERRVGDLILPGAIRILLAANPPEYAAGGWGLEAPFANRMAHFDIGAPSVDEWVSWLQTESSPQVFTVDDATTRLKTNWIKEWAFVRGQLAGYMRSMENRLHNQPKPDSPAAGRQWPSPRTWWMGGRAVATVRALGMRKELEQVFMDGCVGEGPSGEFAEYMANADLPDPEEALMFGWKPDSKRLDRTLAAYSSMVAFVTSIADQRMRFKMAEFCWTRLLELHQAGHGDLTLSPAKSLVAANLGRKNTPDSVKTAAEPLYSKLAATGLAEFLED
jgi:hypothetical protein